MTIGLRLHEHLELLGGHAHDDGHRLGECGREHAREGERRGGWALVVHAERRLRGSIRR